MTQKLKADNTSYASQIFTKGDPKGIFIAVNEFAFHLSPASNNVTSACYWVEWLLEFETLCKKQNQREYRAGRRVSVPVEGKYQTDIIWIVWDVLRIRAREKGTAIRKIAEALFGIFCIGYTPGVKKRRRFYYLFCYFPSP